MSVGWRLKCANMYLHDMQKENILESVGFSMTQMLLSETDIMDMN